MLLFLANIFIIENSVLKLQHCVLQQYQTDLKDLEHLGELGNGTYGHVVKMLHRPSQTVIAVKVCNKISIYSVLCISFSKLQKLQV